MAKDRSFVRASDIGAWTFCHRAWWLSNVKGAVHRSPQSLQRGNEFHRDHNRTVMRAIRLQRLGNLCIGFGLFLGGLFFLIWLWIG